MRYQYEEIAKWYRYLGLDYGASKADVERAYRYLVFLWQSENYAPSQDYREIVGATLSSLSSARENLLSLSTAEIFEAHRQYASRPASTNLPEQGSPRVFISYAREDSQFANRLYSDLSVAQLDPWLDRVKLKPGEKWKQRIQREIKKCDYFLILLSRHSVNKRGFVQREIAWALDALDDVPVHLIFVIPARIEQCEPKDHRLAELQWVDLFGDYEVGLRRIIEVIQINDAKV